LVAVLLVAAGHQRWLLSKAVTALSSLKTVAGYVSGDWSSVVSQSGQDIEGRRIQETAILSG
jgi:hypothetical protein